MTKNKTPRTYRWFVMRVASHPSPKAIWQLMAERYMRQADEDLIQLACIWSPTSQTCACCGHRQSIKLRERWFVCDLCGLEIGRAHNAARNIRREAIALLGVGASTPSLEGARQSFCRVRN